MGSTSKRQARSDAAPVDQVVDLTEPRSARRVAVPPPRSAGHSLGPPSYLPYRYDVHGLVRIGSDVALREIEYFRAPSLQAGYDIEIRRGRVGEGALHRRAVVTQTASPLGVRYEEHLGRFGADVEIRMESPIEVIANPLLCSSPHVLYTNVIEPLLRFVLVSRDAVLLHAACLDVDGCGVLLSAQTDTGKTGTVLRLLRNRVGRFLSDDMTILAPGGIALCYPKPLTISHHTLRAVQSTALTRGEWRRLSVQSRLHSRQGRKVGMRLGQMNLPIMALNAVTQALVPPPKYMVDRLVPCEITARTSAEELFVIERGSPAVCELAQTDLIDQLLENTDDAYGFPPFGYLAAALVIGDDGYDQLRAKERSLLEAAMSGVRARRVVSDDFGWPEMISDLLGEIIAGANREFDHRPSDLLSPRSGVGG
jgi:dolichol-phosphate mannosyltransferase